MVLGAKKAGLVHIWLSIAEGKWSKRSWGIKKKKKQVEGLNQNKKEAKTRRKSNTWSEKIGLQSNSVE